MSSPGEYFLDIQNLRHWAAHERADLVACIQAQAELLVKATAERDEAERLLDLMRDAVDNCRAEIGALAEECQNTMDTIANAAIYGAERVNRIISHGKS